MVPETNEHMNITSTHLGIKCEDSNIDNSEFIDKVVTKRRNMVAK